MGCKENRTVFSKAGKLIANGAINIETSAAPLWKVSYRLVMPGQGATKARLQATLLDRFSSCVQTGGQLVYATCSLSRVENEAVVTTFLSTHPDFALERPAQTFGCDAGPAGLMIMPARHDTDGFFVAALRRR